MHKSHICTSYVLIHCIETSSYIIYRNIFSPINSFIRRVCLTNENNWDLLYNKYSSQLEYFFRHYRRYKYVNVGLWYSLSSKFNDKEVLKSWIIEWRKAKCIIKTLNKIFGYLNNDDKPATKGKYDLLKQGYYIFYKTTFIEYYEKIKKIIQRETDDISALIIAETSKYNVLSKVLIFEAIEVCSFLVVFVFLSK